MSDDVIRLSDLIIAMGGTEVGLMHDPEIWVYDGHYGFQSPAKKDELRLIVDGIGPGAVRRLVLGGAS